MTPHAAIRAVLICAALAAGGCAVTATPGVALRGHFEGGGTVHEVTEATPPAEIDRLVARARAPVYLWIDVGRSDQLADAHPAWIAGIGSHADWRRRFPDAPQPAPGERIGVYPWVSIWYADVLAARRDAIVRLLRGRTQGLAGVFLDHVQGAPSACGCGNDQCRWTVDYRQEGGPAKVDGVPAALLIVALKAELPGVQWIPVIVTECEERDQPGPESTGKCGDVGCFRGLCWKESTRELEALLAATDGPIAVLADEGAFDRKPPAGATSSEPWFAGVLRSLEEVPAAHGRPPLRRDRVILAGSTPRRVEDQALVASRVQRLGAPRPLFLGGDIAARESWRPVRIPVVTNAGSAPVEKSGHGPH